MTTFNDIEARIKHKARIVRGCFDTPAGRETLNFMLAEFDRTDLRGDTTEETYYNLGARDLVIYLRQLVDIQDNEEGIE